MLRRASRVPPSSAIASTRTRVHGDRLLSRTRRRLLSNSTAGVGRFQALYLGREWTSPGARNAGRAWHRRCRTCLSPEKTEGHGGGGAVHPRPLRTAFFLFRSVPLPAESHRPREHRTPP